MVFAGIIFLGLLYYLGILSIKGPCGIKPRAVEGIITMPGKEWGCVCAGKVDKVLKDKTVVYYCTGFNLSFNKLTSFMNKGRQYPVYIK